MGKRPKKQIKTGWLVAALLAVIAGGVIFMGAVSGWFGSKKVTLDAEYYADGAEYMELSADEYEGLVTNKKSFVVMVDQNGCTTADTMREYVTRYMTETGIKVYRMMFEDLKDTTLHDVVKYYPSVVIVDKGRAVGYLRADSNEDAGAYNSYDEFKKWMEKYL